MGKLGCWTRDCNSQIRRVQLRLKHPVAFLVSIPLSANFRAVLYSANNIAYMIVFQRKRKHDIFYQDPITDSIYEHKMQAVLNKTKA